MSPRLADVPRRLAGRVVDHTPQAVVAGGLEVVRRLPIRRGTNVYDREWDVLVVLDGCRYDMYQEVVGPSESLSSVASTSTVWMDETFSAERDDEVAGTAYVSANPYSHRLDAGRFGLLDHVWRDFWDDDLGTIPPDPVTDHGIAAARTGEYERVICHYMQPHFPFVADGKPAFGRLGRSGFDLGDDDSENVWDMVADGDVSIDAVREAFWDNLAYVFASVERLLDNVDGTVAVTADHGNALGEWGMWGHRAYVPSRALRKVPWDVRTCTDGGGYEPETTPFDDAPSSDDGDSTADDDGSADDDEVDEEISERLRALGYAEE